MCEAVEVVLGDEQLERLAELVADRLTRVTVPAIEGELVDVATLARRLCVSTSWVYAHADELRARRLGSGAKPRLRFDARMPSNG